MAGEVLFSTSETFCMRRRKGRGGRKEVVREKRGRDREKREGGGREEREEREEEGRIGRRKGGEGGGREERGKNQYINV